MFPDEFLEKLDGRPQGITVKMDPELAALRDHGKVSGSFHLDLEETGIDWFDLTPQLQLSDIELTPKEIDLQLKHTGAWVRLLQLGWRRLDLAVTDERRQQLADLGLSAADLHSGEKQRLHTLRLAHPTAGAGMLPAKRAEQVRRRAAELRTAVTPALPAGISATLRPYQTEGWHFLAYLSTNRFGGVLADDMGLGKTLQALTWLAWLHESAQTDNIPVLVVCPKSVQDNWTAEAAKFYPSLPVLGWSATNTGDLSDFATPRGGNSNEKSKAAPKTAQRPATPPPVQVIRSTKSPPTASSPARPSRKKCAIFKRPNPL